MKKPYPKGVDLIAAGQCPAGAVSPMGCMFCSYGHMTECHFPKSCDEAQCSHCIDEEISDEEMYL